MLLKVILNFNSNGEIKKPPTLSENFIEKEFFIL